MIEPVPPVTPVVRPRRATSLLNVMLAVAALVAVGGVAFAAGRVTSPTPAAAADAGAVTRPAAKATPPTATSAATASMTLRSEVARRGRATGVTGGTGSIIGVRVPSYS
jgi:hypothetical protein